MNKHRELKKVNLERILVAIGNAINEAPEDHPDRSYLEDTYAHFDKKYEHTYGHPFRILPLP